MAYSIYTTPKASSSKGVIPCPWFTVHFKLFQIIQAKATCKKTLATEV